MRFLKALLIALFIFGALVFFTQNNAELITPLELKFDSYMGHVWTMVAVPFYLVVLIAFFAGCLLMWLLLVMSNIRLRAQKRKAEKKAKKFEAEAKALRAIPLPEQGLNGMLTEKPSQIACKS